MSDGIKRREFLQKILFAGVAATSVGTILSSCGGNSNKPAENKPSAEDKNNSPQNTGQSAANDPCTDLSGLSKEELKVRKAYQYTGHSSNLDQVCSNCNYWQGLKNGGPCGSCQVVHGPINPKGHCTVWTQKTLADFTGLL